MMVRLRVKPDLVAPGIFGLIHRRIRASKNEIGAGFCTIENLHTNAGRAMVLNRRQRAGLDAYR